MFPGELTAFFNGGVNPRPELGEEWPQGEEGHDHAGGAMAPLDKLGFRFPWGWIVCVGGEGGWPVAVWELEIEERLEP